MCKYNLMYFLMFLAFGDDYWKTTAKVVGTVTGIAMVGYSSYKLYNYYYSKEKIESVAEEPVS